MDPLYRIEFPVNLSEDGLTAVFFFRDLYETIPDVKHHPSLKVVTQFPHCVLTTRMSYLVEKHLARFERTQAMIEKSFPGISKEVLFPKTDRFRKLDDGPEKEVREVEYVGLHMLPYIFASCKQCNQGTFDSFRMMLQQKLPEWQEEIGDSETKKALEAYVRQAVRNCRFAMEANIPFPVFPSRESQPLAKKQKISLPTPDSPSPSSSLSDRKMMVRLEQMESQMRKMERDLFELQCRHCAHVELNTEADPDLADAIERRTQELIAAHDEQ